MGREASRERMAAGEGDGREERMAFFDEAEAYTPYLATPAGGALFLVKTEDKHIGRSLFGKQGRGELSVLDRAVAAIDGLLGPSAVTHRSFVDVGANIGTTTIPAVLFHGFDSAVAIEPEPENARVLRMNIVLNDLVDRIEAVQVAVSNEIGRSELVVNRTRGGKHWIATDRSKFKEKPDTEILSVETVTLDHLVETGVIDADRTGLLWMDAEAHEGHILEGGPSLIARGTPLVLELNPAYLERVGDPGKVRQALEEHYTHFAAMHRNRERRRPSFPLLGVDKLSDYAEDFLDESRQQHKTDILVLRLERDQAAGVKALDAVIKRRRAA